MTPARRGPAGHITGLNRWLDEWAKETGVASGRLRRRVGVIAVAAMLDSCRDADGGHLFHFKGGSALELRFGDRARTSKDLDAVFRGLMSEAQSVIGGALAAGWSGFTGRVTKVEEITTATRTVKPLRITTKLRYLAKDFCTLPLEIAPPEGAMGSPDAVTIMPMAEVGLEPPTSVPCLSLRYQIAQKLHACTEQLTDGKPNPRARDVADLLLIRELAGDDLDLADVRAACVDIFDVRDLHPWPPALVPAEEWPALWAKLVEDENFPVRDLDEAVEQVRAFITDIDAAR